MLVLTRRSEESIVIGGNVEIKVLNVRGDQVSLGFDAPHEVSIFRKEVYEAIEKENRKAALRGNEEWKTISKGLKDDLPADQEVPRREGTDNA
jgi:carbon storage regulator